MKPMISIQLIKKKYKSKRVQESLRMLLILKKIQALNWLQPMWFLYKWKSADKTIPV